MVSPTASQLPMVGTKVWGCPVTLLGALGSPRPSGIRTVFPRLEFRAHSTHFFSVCLLGEGAHYSLSSWLWLLHGPLSVLQGPKPGRAKEDRGRLLWKVQQTWAFILP